MEDLFSPCIPQSFSALALVIWLNDKVEFFHSKNLLMAVRVKGACPQLFTVLQGTIHNLIISRIMKKMLFFAGLALLMASCTTIRKSASTANVPAQLLSATVADLDVAKDRITYVYDVPAEVRRGGAANVRQAAIQAALESVGNQYDLLVEPEFSTYTTKYFVIPAKVTKVVVSGRPAKYKGFHSLNDSVWCNQLFRSLYRNQVQHGKIK